MAGKITKPNPFQKLLHRFVMIRPVTAFFAPWIHRLDRIFIERTNGKHSLAEILGWPIVEVTTIGAKTNQPRSIPLIGIIEGRTIALIASSFGRARNPGWYYNLKAHPECTVLFNERAGRYVAREMEGDEYDHYWQMAVAIYEGYEKYKQRAAHRHIPVMLLEPRE